MSGSFTSVSRCRECAHLRTESVEKLGGTIASCAVLFSSPHLLFNNLESTRVALEQIISQVSRLCEFNLIEEPDCETVNDTTFDLQFINLHLVVSELDNINSINSPLLDEPADLSDEEKLKEITADLCGFCKILKPGSKMLNEDNRKNLNFHLKTKIKLFIETLQRRLQRIEQILREGPIVPKCPKFKDRYNLDEQP